MIFHLFAPALAELVINHYSNSPQGSVSSLIVQAHRLFKAWFRNFRILTCGGEFAAVGADEAVGGDVPLLSAVETTVGGFVFLQTADIASRASTSAVQPIAVGV